MHDFPAVSINRQDYYPCVAWSPSKSDPYLLAAGLHTGSTVLFRFYDARNTIKEFSPPPRCVITPSLFPIASCPFPLW